MPLVWWWHRGLDKQPAEVNITLRLPFAVAAGMKHSAQENDRSLNGEMVRAVREYLSRSGSEHHSRA
jgi:hypothetical protein